MRRPTWKQDTPRMQFVAIMQSIEGWVINLESGRSPLERALSFIKPAIQELKELSATYTSETWEVSANAENDALRALARAVMAEHRGGAYTIAEQRLVALLNDLDKTHGYVAPDQVEPVMIQGDD